MDDTQEACSFVHDGDTTSVTIYESPLDSNLASSLDKALFVCLARDLDLAYVQKPGIEFYIPYAIKISVSPRTLPGIEFRSLPVKWLHPSPHVRHETSA